VCEANREKHSKRFSLALFVISNEKTFGNFNRQIELSEVIESLLDMLGRGCRSARRVSPVGRNKMTLASNPSDGDTICQQVLNLRNISAGIITTLNIVKYFYLPIVIWVATKRTYK
jgi:hypothetical protein